MIRLLICFFLTFPSLASAQGNALFSFAILRTSFGDIELKLFKKEAPSFVDNFVGLSNGEKQFRDVRSGRKVKDVPFYQNMIFHKVHPELGIQSGCPWGNGKGWPGFTMKQETNELKFDKPYLVAMAKISGDDNSVGSQFFITTRKAMHLNETYTVIGEVTKGFSVVDKISKVPRDAMMKPLKPIKLTKIDVEK